jgi:LmbE family N-acetylglucosaminyl deacetylase
MKFLAYDRVLCLAPHPDDVEYSMAGTIMKYQDTVFDILCLTQGGDCDDTTSSNRLKEVETCWQQLSVCNNVNLHFTTVKFLKDWSEDRWINYIETNFLYGNSYDAIFLPSSDDSHFEHRLVSGFGWPLSRVSAISLIEYCAPSALSSWVPNLFVDVSSVYNEKKFMLKGFTSQQHRSYFQEEQIDGFHTEFQCSKKGMTKVERFNIKQDFK